jgi:hypothetical protein
MDESRTQVKSFMYRRPPRCKGFDVELQRRVRSCIRQAQDDRFPSPYRIDLERDPGPVEGQWRRIALHRAGQADTERLSRVLFPMLPALLYPMIAGLRERMFLAVFSLGPALGLAPLSLYLQKDYRTNVLLTVDERDAVAQWLNANVPLGSTVLIHDAGYPAFRTKLSFGME